MGFLDFLRQFWKDTQAAWRKLSLSARVNIALAAIAVAGLILYVAFSGAPPLYRELTSSADPAVVNQIRTVLVEQGVEHKIENNEKVLVVASPQKFDELRLVLLERNIPLTRSTLPGFESIQQGDLMANQWLQDMKYMVALQGELQNQLNLFDFVNFSKVIIREAPTELFRDDQKQSEALVTLDLKRDLSNREIKGIVEMVAAAGGPHLSPNNVTLSTTRGEFLWSPFHDDVVSLASSRREITAEIERVYESKLQRMYDRMGVLATVTVSAKTTWDEVETTTSEVTEGVPLSEAIMSRSTSSTETLPEGSPGALANVPEATTSTGSIVLEEEESETITNYENGSRFTTTKTAPGDVLQFQAAVVIAEEYEEDTVDENGNVVSGQPIPLTPEKEADYVQIAQAALAGGQLEPVVTVVSHPFKVDRMAVTAATQIASAASMDQRKQLAWQATQILMIIAFFVLARMLLRRAIQYPQELVEEEEVAEIPEATREDMRRQEVAAQIAHLAQENPEMVALLLRAWINESNE